MTVEYPEARIQQTESWLGFPGLELKKKKKPKVEWFLVSDILFFFF